MYWNSYMAPPMRKILDTGSVIIINKTILLFDVDLPNLSRDQQTIQSFFNTLLNVQIKRSKMNRLIRGNNLLAMQALLASGYEGKINLMYIDPPFWTNENYYAKFEVGSKEIAK